MKTKKELLSELSFEYLREFAVKTKIIQTRGVYHTKKDHVRGLSRSLSRSEVEYLYKSYQSNESIEDTSHTFLRTYRPNDAVVREEVTEFLKSSKYNNQDVSFLFEVSVLSNRADVMVVDDSITIYEIKSPRDSYRRLSDQLNTYLNIADYVNVVHPADGRSVEQIRDGVGVIEFSYPDFEFDVVREEKAQDPKISDRIAVLWKSELREISKRLLPQSSHSTERPEIERRLQQTCYQNELNDHIIHQLKNRCGMTTSNPDQHTLSV